ncbi:unnamed protein product [Microthlaspi erraticum]|uniref:Replication protein A 70 kDa DNA-binding subunit B/D first OB fold domain-containing protein n=1 Tax=Microthlaspi erraticum TaxID=1685480 RepID=A0A6D2IYR2_9BRAS|nr:unnamed protein product [Microthlaspi erraticum]
MGRTLNFILVDEEGTKIHATVNRPAINLFDSLPEGSWAQISGVCVSSSNWIDCNHFLSTHPYMLVLPSTATISPISPLTDRHFFNFALFEDVMSGFFNIAYPIDLIGTIHIVGKLSPAKNSANAERSIPFTIRDQSGNELYCIAYGRVTEKFSLEWSLIPDGDVRILLSEWRVSASRKMYSGLAENMIVDGGKYCRFYLNPEFPGVGGDAHAMERRDESEMEISAVDDSDALSTA